MRAEALRLGFTGVAIARIEAAGASDARGKQAADHYLAWLARGDHAGMGYMARMAALRAHPAHLWPEARSLVAVAWSYWRPDEPDGAVARFARYARGRDYHRAVGTRLRALARFARTLAPGLEARAAVDTGPLLERAWAEIAGLGFIGKHSGLIRKDSGNWTLLGELLVSAELVPDPPVVRRCGSCQRCLDACPTGAIPEPYRVDARRCISYLTIEHRGPIPLELRPAIGERIFGCDDCLDACPWNRFAQAAASDEVRARPGVLETPLERWLDLDEPAFRRTFTGSAVLRARRAGFLRNVCVALGNRGDRASVPALDRALHDAEPLVRAHAAWALGRIGGSAALGTLARAHSDEIDASVREEIAAAIGATT